MNKDGKLLSEAYTKVLEQQAPSPAAQGNAKELVDMLIKGFVPITNDNILKQKINEFVRSTPAGKDGSYGELVAQALYQQVKAVQQGKQSPLGKAVPMPGVNVQKQNTAVPMPYSASKNFAVPMPGAIKP